MSKSYVSDSRSLQLGQNNLSFQKFSIIIENACSEPANWEKNRLTKRWISDPESGDQRIFGGCSISIWIFWGLFRSFSGCSVLRVLRPGGVGTPANSPARGCPSAPALRASAPGLLRAGEFVRSGPTKLRSGSPSLRCGAPHPLRGRVQTCGLGSKRSESGLCSAKRSEFLYDLCWPK